MSVKVRAPILRGCAFSFEKAISIGFRSGLYGGRNKNQHPASRIALEAEGFLCEMTTLPAPSSGISTCSM